MVRSLEVNREKKLAKTFFDQGSQWRCNVISICLKKSFLSKIFWLPPKVPCVRHVWPVGGDLFDAQIHKCGLPIGNLTSTV